MSGDNYQRKYSLFNLVINVAFDDEIFLDVEGQPVNFKHFLQTVLKWINEEANVSLHATLLLQMFSAHDQVYRPMETTR